MDRDHEIWCVPYGFDDPYTALNGLCHVKGDFEGDVTTLNSNGCVMVASSFVGRLELFYGGNLTHSLGSGAQIFKELFESDPPSGIDPLVVAVAVQADVPAMGRTRNPTTFFTIGQAAHFARGGGGGGGGAGRRTAPSSHRRSHIRRASPS